MKADKPDSDDKNSLFSLGRLKSLLLFFMGIILTISLIRNITTIISAEKRIKQAFERLKEVQEENSSYSSQLEQVESDFYKEKQARDQLRLSKEGEVVIILPEEELLRRLSPIMEEFEEEQLPDPTWKKWRNLFF